MLSDRHGLDLTCATVSALCKYTAGSADANEESGPASAKPGFFVSERKVIEAVRDETGTDDSRNPITHLVEAADDIVYSTVDIEDGVRKGVLDWDTLATDLLAEVGPDADRVDHLLQKSEAYVSSGGLALRGSERDGALVQILRTYMIGELVAAAVEAYKRNYRQIMEGQYKKELMADCGSHRLWNACKTIGRKRIYPAKQTLRLELMGRRIISDLMSLLWEGAQDAPHQKTKTFAGKAYALLSSNYRTLFEDAIRGTKDESKRTYLRLQLVADYVAGMTDTFAATLHRQLTNDV
jgi:dGTPase